MDHVFRQATRVLVLTPEGRVLLLRLTPSFRGPFWVTPRGGLDEGESFEVPAGRELREDVTVCTTVEGSSVSTGR